jgi:stage V sporulation protein B
MLYRFYGNRYRSVEIYGILSGMALPFIMFPSTITNALSLMLLPKISAAKTHNDPSYLRRCAILPLIFCTFLGIGAFGGFFVFGPWIGNFFFHNPLSKSYKYA